MTEPAERLVEAEAAKAAWERFVGPALTTLRAEYLSKMAKLGVQPMEPGGHALGAVQALAHALRVTDQVEAQMMALITDASAARADIDRAAHIARMSPEARRWATY